MANGKIIYTPCGSSALSMDGSHYPQIDHADFNVGTGGFAIDLVGRINTGSPATVNLFDKSPTAWASESGYLFFADTSTRTLKLTVNDGNASSITVSSNAGVFSLDSYQHLALRADRGDYGVRFYVNGVDMGGASIGSRSGSLDNSNPVKIGQSIIGYLGMVRFGKILPPFGWYPIEYTRRSYGYPPALSDFMALWPFASSLIDVSPNAYTLVWQGGGSPSYVAGWPSGPLSYTFPYHYEYPFDDEFLDLDDRQRAIDGTAFLYAGARKRRYRVKFPIAKESQKIILDSIYAGGYDFGFYEDSAGLKTFQGIMTGPPRTTGQFYDGYEVEVEMEEV